MEVGILQQRSLCLFNPFSFSSQFSHFQNPNFAFIPLSKRNHFRLLTISKNNGRRGILACSKPTNSFQNQSPESDASAASTKEARFDLKLPRRSLIVQFTCNECGERTQRTINRIAYEKGTVFVQCAGCLVHHKLVDNLGLVVEYDLREEEDVDSDGINEP